MSLPMLLGKDILGSCSASVVVMTAPNDHQAAPDPAADLAARLLARYGSAPEEATRPAYGYANEVWIGRTVVVHVKRGVNGGLAREAAVAAILPAEVGVPEVLDRGVTGGMEWMINKRLAGDNLKVAWPGLDAGARAAAATDLWARLRHVHRAEVAAARAIGCTTTPFYALEPARARLLLDLLLENEILDQPLHDRVAGLLGRMFEAMPSSPVVLTHTDAGPHNAVWDGRHAVPVDFETAAVAPPDLDLECLLRTLNLHPGPSPAHTVLQEAGDLLARPGAGDRLLGYAVLRDLWESRSWLGDLRAGGRLQDHEADVNDPTTWLPVRQLRRHVSGTSWMADLLR